MAKEKKKSRKFRYSSTDLINYIWQKRIPLLLIISIALVLSIIASLLITPFYKSELVLFPSSGSSVSHILSNHALPGKYNVYEIGDERELEKLLQILKSIEIRDRIIEKYNFSGHYGFSPGTKHLQSKLHSIYNKNVDFRKTPYNSVIIRVMDKNPQMAADIANEIAALTDSVYHRIFRTRSLETFKLVESEYNSSLTDLIKLRDSMAVINKLGVLDYETQSERYHEAYGKAVVENNPQAVRQIDQKLSLLSKYGTSFLSLKSEIEFESERLSLLKQRYAEAKLEYEQSIPYTFIVNKAEVADLKTSPKRSLIVIISTFSAFLLGLIMLLAYDFYLRKYR
jgi:capsular polysaccharide biosynthesis protein